MLLLASALLFANLGDFTLDSGKVIQDLKLGYRTYGTRNADDSNIVLFPTWFNGTTELLEQYVTGPNPFVDSNKYFVITIDAIGNGVSSSPSNSTAQKGKLFPRFTMSDIVRSQYQFLTTQLGIKRLHAVMGISMGGMQTFEWMARYPGFMKKGISIVGTPIMSGNDALLWMQMAEKMASGQKKEGQSAAGNEDMQTKIINAIGGILASKKDGGGSKLPMPDNALRQFDAMASHDATKRYNRSLEAMTKAITADVIMFIADNDQAVSGDVPLKFAKLKGCRVVHLTSPEGHNAYKVERELISREALPFMDGTTPAPPKPRTSIFQE